MELRDEGRVEEAKLVLDSNVLYLRENAEKYDSKDLRVYTVDNQDAADKIDDDEAWKKQRKVMKEEQRVIQKQQMRKAE
jgi:hypothetical protein